MNPPLATPVLLLVFNRPESTQRVFHEIRKARPARLFISADGPRASRPGEPALCEAARAIVKQVDWDCDLHTLFRENNLGCRMAISSAVTWLFQNVEEGIILEDDCLPSQSFFWFCQELLKHYRDDERVMQISGSNHLFGRRTGPASYYFSQINDIWGWATWARAWRYFDLSMKGYPEFRKSSELAGKLGNRSIATWLTKYLDAAYEEKDNVWSSQWAYAVLVRNGLTIVPNVNLVSNIGFGEGATTSGDKVWKLYEQVRSEEMNELVHPATIAPDAGADRLRFEVIQKTDPRAKPQMPRPVRKARSALARLKRISGI